ncbi:type III restriction enzyme [Parabacteroides sp. PFB2-10]|uniref:restriction endonuclease n=1 Tax=Parabacteroides sp. PFB2-10 TaxID=1742405 RepID=UPI0024759514|nr:DEAD/DEAH box helicase family protein [Parabacteroides sp. PFB2-10]MDH6312659.1 type III restriction enzyme [Parabacteroides sp. PFB2-10]
MAKETKIKFNPNLDYQKQAVSSSLLIFNGQRKSSSPFTISQGIGMFTQDEDSLVVGEGNRLTISEGKILDNLRSIQMENGLDVSENMKMPDFTIEMETGTGKTYVYLRSIINMYLEYDFKKFIIVVPNRAIREGVNASLKDLQDHFHALYGVRYRHFIYNSQDLGQVTSYARATTLEIMIINISAFNRSFKDIKKEDKANVIHRPNEKTHGRKPIDLLAETNPIVIIDEPQSVDNTDNAKVAIASLNPLALFRYSATHRQITNPIYKLGPVEAYNQELVKQIEVLSIFEDSDLNGLYIKVISTNPSKREAELEMNFINSSGHAKREHKKVAYNRLLHEVTKNPAYIGCRLTNIDDNSIELNGHEKLYIGNVKTNNLLYSDDELKRQMIRETIKVHFEKQLSLLDKGVKVLSLFFIDRVANFRDYGAEDQRGKYAKLFDEEFLKLTQENAFYQELFNRWGGSVSKLREGYFSEDKKGLLKDTKGDTDDDISTYDKIMKRKGILLSETEPIRFIFSHSALREGWDNPNVFQICILKDPQIKEDKNIRLRQEIGRGLRIAVNQNGERVHDKGVNTLTVTANETFGDFVSRFQTELKDDIGEEFNKITPHKFRNITYMDNDGVRHILGDALAEKLYSHFEDEGLVVKHKPTEKLQDALKINPQSIVPKEEVFQPYEEAIIKRTEELATKIEITKYKPKQKVRINKQVRCSEEFNALWDKIKHKTTYSVDYNVHNFKLKCIKELNELEVRKIVYNIEKGTIQIDSDKGVSDKDGVKTDFNAMSYSGKVQIPDIIRYLQNETGLKRQTLIELLSETKTLGQIIYNPQLYMELVRDTIKRLMQHELVEGIKYERIGEEYVMELPANDEIEQFFNKLIAETPNRCILDHISVDSQEEQKFAQQLDNNEKVSCFMKLPSSFKIDTPLGSYNPDWAVYVKGIENKVYFIVETKGTNIFSELKPSEQDKINCAKKHFEVAAPEVIVAAPVKGGEANRWLSGL